MKPFDTIGDLIDVPPVRTVVQLEDGRRRTRAILHSFVFTAETAAHLTVLTDALQKEHGRGFFLMGDFGAGKSHFLAFLSAWLSDPPPADVLTSHHAGLAQLQASGRRFLTLPISLIRYRAGTPLERIVIEGLENALASVGTRVQLSPIRRFLKTFRALLKDGAAADNYARQLAVTTADIDTYIDAHPRQAYVQALRFLKSSGMQMPESLLEERHETFARALTAVAAAGFDGTLLLIDELSEFFRAKADARSLNEDARTLQFLGELCESHPLWIIAAVQESIERTGDIAQVTFKKIKDRFPLKMVLSTLHIKSLIAERLVRPKPGSASRIREVFDYLKQQFPEMHWNFEDFRHTYPVHPLTIDLLDGLGDLFSEHRGIVDFVHCQLAGDHNRNIAGILDRPAYELLAPDSIYTHFCDRMAEFSAFNVYPRHIVPHLDTVIAQAFDSPSDRRLARRIVRMLVLYAIHPTADPPPVKVLAGLCTAAISDTDPALNVEFVAEAILDPLVTASKFLVRASPPATDAMDAVYRVTTKEDPAKRLGQRIAQRAAEIPPEDRRLLLAPLALLEESPSWPGPELLAEGLYRPVRWRQSIRRAWACFSTARDPETLRRDIVRRLDSGEADFAVVFAFAETAPDLQHTAAWQFPVPPQPGQLDALREYAAAVQVAAELRPGNPADAALIEPAEHALAQLAPAACHTALEVFYAGRFSDTGMPVENVIRQLKRFDRLLEIAGQYLLEKRYPAFRQVAPRRVVPSAALYQRLIDAFVAPGRISLQQAHRQKLADAIDGLARPLGLVELKSGAYVLSPDPENHALISEVFSRIRASGQTDLKTLMQQLRTGAFGLPADTAAFFISALAYGGLITLLKGGRTFPVEMLGMLSVEKLDAVAPGELISRSDRSTLTAECPFLAPPDGWGAFGLKQQRTAWQMLTRFRERARRIVEDIRTHMDSMSDFSSFQHFDMQELNRRLNALDQVASEIKVSYHAREGLERFLSAWRGAQLTAAHLQWLQNLRRFLATDAQNFVFICHYLRHQAVEQASAADPALAARRSAVQELVDQPESLLTADGPARLKTAFEDFRKNYLAAYQRQHHDYYRRFAQKPLSRFAKRALALLKRLSAIETLDRPPGTRQLIHTLEHPRVTPCRRQVAEELLRYPVCGCGFLPGGSAPPNGIGNTAAALEKTLAAYVEILRQPRIREAIAARLFALSEALPEAAARLRRLAGVLETQARSTAALLEVLDTETLNQLARSLAGQVRIAHRDISALTAGLEGRRLTPDQIMQAFKAWLAEAEADCILAIEDSGRRPDTNGPSGCSWWPALHPALFPATGLSKPPIDALQHTLEKAYPSPELRHRLSRLDEKQLADFICNEPLHTGAICQAWRLLAERQLEQSPEPLAGAHKSRHADRRVAQQIEKRLAVLGSVVRFGRASLPRALRGRIALSEMLSDPWATSELRRLIRERIESLSARANEWVATLPPTEPIPLQGAPLVLIIDGVSPDVWLEVHDNLPPDIRTPAFSWQRLTAVPFTAPAVSAMFGFDEDAVDELAARGVPYHRLRGDEAADFDALLPAFPADTAIVIHVSLLDAGAHGAYLQLHDMPAVLLNFLRHKMPFLLESAGARQQGLIVTTDHGLSLTARGLAHGRGGPFECAIFRWHVPPVSQI